MDRDKVWTVPAIHISRLGNLFEIVVLDLKFVS